MIRVDCGASTALTGKHNVVGWQRRFVKGQKHKWDTSRTGKKVAEVLKSGGILKLAALSK